LSTIGLNQKSGFLALMSSDCKVNVAGELSVAGERALFDELLVREHCLVSVAGERVLFGKCCW